MGPRSNDSAQTPAAAAVAAVLQAMGPKQANEMLESAKLEVIRRGLDKEPPNLGDQLLKREAVDPKLRIALEELRKEGVRDDDIRWWWNLPPLERLLIERTDEMMRASSFIAFLRQGKEPAQAAKAAFQAHAKFGNPQEGRDDDRPLPIELKRRIWAYTEKHYAKPDELRLKMQQSSSFNALLRAEMRNSIL
jgi:hypothetical protein